MKSKFARWPESKSRNDGIRWVFFFSASNCCRHSPCAHMRFSGDFRSLISLLFLNESKFAYVRRAVPVAEDRTKQRRFTHEIPKKAGKKKVECENYDENWECREWVAHKIPGNCRSSFRLLWPKWMCLHTSISMHTRFICTMAIHTHTHAGLRWRCVFVIAEHTNESSDVVWNIFAVSLHAKAEAAENKYFIFNSMDHIFLLPGYILKASLSGFHLAIVALSARWLTASAGWCMISFRFRHFFSFFFQPVQIYAAAQTHALLCRCMRNAKRLH